MRGAVTRGIGPPRRIVASALAAALALLAVACVGDDRKPPPTDVEGEVPPNVILVVTDDQTAASMDAHPDAMPWLRRKLAEPGWTTFTNAVVSTPLCCPSRATIFTGRYARHTGVLTNGDGERLDDEDTVATWLHEAGYRTALIGKYLNGYPWSDPPPVPPGWDRWFAKLNASSETVYRGYEVVDDGSRLTVGTEVDDYATDRLASEALAFVADAPADRPFFLTFTPSAPHEPAEPAPRHASLLDPGPGEVDPATLAAMNEVSHGPDWIQARPSIDEETAAALAAAQLRERVALRAVDDALRALWAAVDERGELHRTVWLFLSDNGYSFGDRRWVGKTCPWETCIHVPFVAHVPGSPGGTSDALVANIDVAPTIAELAGVDPGSVDGLSLAPMLRGDADPPDRRTVLLEWTGHADVPPWVGIRLPHAVLIRHADGTDELYDLAADPAQRRNLVDTAAATDLQRHAERALARSVAAVGTGG